ncbi:MAG: pantoate--beta-alanine ligase, partial [Bdellovibrionota bacterium]
MPRIFESVAEWKKFRPELSGGLGFVPTMGALHEGHLSLCERSREENAGTLVSLFVNPTQFNDPRDLERYPRTLEADLEKLTRAGVDYVLCPSSSELYPDDYRFRVSESEKSVLLCGAHRPGHFDGVLTVVLKLLNLAGADAAYFGEKDFQQLTLIREMTEALFHPTRIVGCPTVREADGLAMSSRNRLLSPEARKLAPALASVL